MTGKRKSLKKRKPLSDKPDKTLLKRDIAALAEATGQLPPDPFPHQLAISGWLEPDLTPKLVAEALDNSLMEYEIDPVVAMIWARDIYDSSLEGAELETPGERATTEVKAQKELENLHKLLCQLERELGRIGRPANQILFANRCDPQLLKKVVSNAANASEEGLKYYNVPEHVAFAESAGGRPPKEKARLVTDTTAMAFEALTGRRAGYTNDNYSEKSERSGDFLTTLISVFNALRITANAEDQTRNWKADHPIRVASDSDKSDSDDLESLLNFVTTSKDAEKTP